MTGEGARQAVGERGGVGYFGKLPDRADFVMGSCPAGFLKVWEPFLMTGLGRAREELGEAWEDAYMTMPVWRFWLTPAEGEASLNGSVAGAIMPSVDRVGRKFPLTVAASVPDGEPGEAVEGEDADWYVSLEAVLLGALEEEATLSGFQQALAELGLPDGGLCEPEGEAERQLAPDDVPGPVVRSHFWSRTGDRHFAFSCPGIPKAEAFRWLLLPETSVTAGTAQDQAGSLHGRNQRKDCRT